MVVSIAGVAGCTGVLGWICLQQYEDYLEKHNNQTKHKKDELVEKEQKDKQQNLDTHVLDKLRPVTKAGLNKYISDQMVGYKEEVIKNIYDEDIEQRAFNTAKYGGRTFYMYNISVLPNRPNIGDMDTCKILKEELPKYKKHLTDKGIDLDVTYEESNGCRYKFKF